MIDRYARFMSHGSTREAFDWGEMYKTEIPIPSIEKQKQIVKEYNVIINRLHENKKRILKLEETAQALYKQWFIDFEFLNDNEETYKSSGGKMIFNNDLELDIPQDWKVVKLKDCAEVIKGFTGKYTSKSDLINFNQKVNQGVFLDFKSVKYLTDNNSIPNQKYAQKKDILLNSLGLGTLGRVHYFLLDDKNFIVDGCITIIRAKDIMLSKNFLYLFLISNYSKNYFEKFTVGSTGQASLKKEDIQNMNIFVPDIKIQNRFEKILDPLFKLKIQFIKENEILTELEQKLCSKLSLL